MQSLMRFLCLGYSIYLTALLLTADPAQLVGGSLPGFLRSTMPVAHLLSFFVLAVLALAIRWPAPRWAVVIILVIYGGLTEIAQGFLPPRTPDWMDWFQDVAGITVGAVSCWIVALVAGAYARARQNLAGCAAPVSADGCEATVEITEHMAAGGQSWWR